MDFWGLAASIAISFSASFIFAYILFWLDLYEKEPLILLGVVFTWGAIVAAGSAFFINTVIGLGVFVATGSETASNLTTTAVVAPVIEELLKGFAVFLVFIIFTKEFDSVLDGIVYAGVAALGFSATENAYYIYVYGFVEDGWQGFWSLSFIRLVLVGWQHPFYTAFFGIGLATARLNRSPLVKLVAPVVGLSLAMGAHAVHNILASFFPGVGGMAFTTLIDWVGWLLMLGFIFIIQGVERRDLIAYLTPEVTQGTLTQTQLEVATSPLKIALVRFSALFQGQYRTITRFFHLTAKLSLKKKHHERLGEEQGNSIAIQDLREKISTFSPSLQI